MEWVTAQSMTRPDVQDTATSKVYNYIRRNIQEIQVESMDGQTATGYEYEEAKVNKESWSIYQQLEQACADIDYLNMLTEDL